MNFLYKIESFILKNRSDFERMAGTLILVSIALSNSVGVFPAILLACSGFFYFVSQTVAANANMFRTSVIMHVLFLPLVRYWHVDWAVGLFYFIIAILALADLFSVKEANNGDG